MHDLVEHYAEGIHYSGCSVSSEFSCNYNPIIFETVFFHFMKTRYFTAIPNREVQGFYREIRVQGNSNYMLCQCTGFEGSNFNEIQGNVCILYRN